MADGKVVFEIQGDPKGINTTLKDVTANIEKESKKWDDAAEKSTASMDGVFKSFLKGLVGAFSAAGIAKIILDWDKAAVQAASDLAEVQNVVDVTFGESTKKIDAWAQAAGKNFGLTETQAKKYTSTIGAMMKSQGIVGDNIVEMSTDLAGLAADMASFYNLDFDTAFDKIRSGISGETMPLKQLGINMSVANLEAFALEQGIKKTYTAMSSGEQTILRYQYLMKATADAQGDFARTADGFANATRRVETSIETIKTKGGALLMTVVEPLVGEIADLLDQITETRDQTAMDMFEDINRQTAQQLASIEQAYGKASEILKLMDKERKQIAENTAITYEELFSRIRDVENSGGNISEYLQSQGYNVDAVTQKYLYWKEAVSQLKDIFPSLTAEIEKSSYAGDGTVEAMQSDFDAWQTNEEKKLAYSAYYSKQRALEEKKSEQYLYQYEADRAFETGLRTRNEMVAKYGEEAVSKLEDAYTKYGNAMRFGLSIGATFKPNEAGEFGILNSDAQAYLDAIDDATEKKSILKNQTEALTQAEKENADGLAALEKKYGKLETSIDGATDATSAWTAEQQTAGQTALASLQAIADYADTVRDATEKIVDGIVKGFATLERPTTELEKKRDKLIQQQNELNRSTRDGAKRYDELQTQIDELNKSLDEYSPKGMQDALKSQLAFMEEYISNLGKARSLGLSDALLASLSDGSVQSAEYLAALVSNPEQAAAVEALYQQVQQKKSEFTDALTEQKLSADETFQSIVETAQNAVSSLDLGEEATDAMGKTVSGIAQGIADHIPEVQTQVDALIAQLNRLNGVGITFDLSGIPSGDNWSLIGTTGEVIRRKPAGHESGLDYVPYNGYFASLHEGESILTAEENRMWQRFKNGAMPQTMDYDALGATMRENVHAGGNVYLDGRTVGQVISQQQGNSFRSLQRSGFQA